MFIVSCFKLYLIIQKAPEPDITKTYPCNIQKKKMAEKMKFFTRKILIFFLFLLKT